MRLFLLLAQKETFIASEQRSSSFSWNFNIPFGFPFPNLLFIRSSKTVDENFIHDKRTFFLVIPFKIEARLTYLPGSHKKSKAEPEN